MDARQSKTVLDSGFNAVGSGFFVSGNWIFIGISDSLNCIKGFKALDSGFHSKNLLESVFHKQGDDTQALIT